MADSTRCAGSNEPEMKGNLSNFELSSLADVSAAAIADLSPHAGKSELVEVF